VVLLGLLFGFRRQRISVSPIRVLINLILINRFIGTLKHFCLMGVDGEPAVGSARLPAIVYAAYQGMFAVCHPIYHERGVC
jgi:ammonia channel protein AmtB